jgi:hypothetical protein
MAERRPPGRPPLQRGAPSVGLNIRLPAAQYDRLYQQAQAARVDNLSAFIRQRLEAGDDDDSDED